MLPSQLLEGGMKPDGWKRRKHLNEGLIPDNLEEISITLASLLLVFTVREQG